MTDRGFTLIELIVVMTLIGLTTAFTIPKIRTSLFTDELKATAREFIGLVSDIGQEARSKRVQILLRFDPDNHMFTTAPAVRTTLEDKVERYLEIEVPDSVQVVDVMSSHGGRKTEGELVIPFNSQGYVDKTIVHFRDGGGDEISVMLSPFLGVTRVLEGYVALEDDRFYLAGN